MRSTERFFAQNPVFSLDAFARDIGAGKSVDTAYRHLDYYVRSGRLRRIRSKLYAVVPLDTEAETFTPDPYLVASIAGRGAPLGYHTALELLGVGHSVFHNLTVVSDKWAKPFEFDDRRVEFVKTPAGLSVAGKVDLGVTSVRRSGRELTITGRERTLVDCLLRPGRAGGVEEVLNSLDGFGVMREIMERWARVTRPLARIEFDGIVMTVAGRGYDRRCGFCRTARTVIRGQLRVDVLKSDCPFEPDPGDHRPRHGEELIGFVVELLEIESGQRVSRQIVRERPDPSAGVITWESPIAQALSRAGGLRAEQGTVIRIHNRPMYELIRITSPEISFT